MQRVMTTLYDSINNVIPVHRHVGWWRGQKVVSFVVLTHQFRSTRRLYLLLLYRLCDRVADYMRHRRDNGRPKSTDSRHIVTRKDVGFFHHSNPFIQICNHPLVRLGIVCLGHVMSNNSHHNICQSGIQNATKKEFLLIFK
jgi:hypothetical protein